MTRFITHGICFLVCSKVAFGSESCQIIPTAATLGTSPYSSATSTVISDGITQVEVLEYYKSVTYVSKCEDTASSTTSNIGTTTIPVFR